MKKLSLLLLLAVAACNTPDAAQKMKESSQPQSAGVQQYPANPDPTATYSATSGSTTVSPNISAIRGR